MTIPCTVYVNRKTSSRICHDTKNGHVVILVQNQWITLNSGVKTKNYLPSNLQYTWHLNSHQNCKIAKTASFISYDLGTTTSADQPISKIGYFKLFCDDTVNAWTFAIGLIWSVKHSMHPWVLFKGGDNSSIYHPLLEYKSISSFLII